MFQADVKILESNADSIFKEFECVYASTVGWVCNTTPTGKWLVFHLVNQGTKLEDNCKKCPHTVSLLKALPSFMGCNLLGNASFSVVYPGTEIAEHFGPTNIRIRTHLGLVVPPECELHVGGQTATWKQGQCTVFDDSFSHSVKHSVKGEGSRVVFMVDLWHPGLTLEEKIALDFIYSPDL
ncbi:aspartate beta-hydroxylase domain-containing protein 2 [Lingula anatina]|nr:aspartate beta-hydroxylase domain-containing protein 2 [Lingula anatina]|eukprot:XP_013387364.2 aspartate beta-hydroxylase domain-containing protein 2 [Lingula anatina]